MSSFRIIFLLLTITTFVCSEPLNSDALLESLMDNPRELFKAYYSIYEKHQHYDINSLEGAEKYQIFKSNLEEIKLMNEEAGVKTYGITPFTDMTNQEYRDSVLVSSESLERNLEKKFGKKPSEVSDSFLSYATNVDWRSRMGPVKNQFTCGSCWAFASIAAVEGNYSIQFWKNLNLSEQYLVDCVEKNYGCRGGDLLTTFKFLKSNGVKYQSTLPYKNVQNYCPSNFKEGAMNLVKDFDECTTCYYKNESWYNMIRSGPLVVYVDSSSKEFKNYRPINDKIPLIPSVCSNINHAVTAVGVRIENGEPQLIIRNSWGTNWGYNGYYTTPAKNHCFVLDNAIRPIVQQDTPFVDTENCFTVSDSCDPNSKQSKTICNNYGVGNSETLFGSGKTIVGFSIENSNNQFWNFYYQANCSGSGLKTSQSIDCFTNYSNIYKFKSIINTVNSVAAGCVHLYSDTCLSGTEISICINIGNTSGMDLSSIKSARFSAMSKNGKKINSLIFFSGENYTGQSYSLSSSGDNSTTQSTYVNLTTNSTFQQIISTAKSIMIVES